MQGKIKEVENQKRITITMRTRWKEKNRSEHLKICDVHYLKNKKTTWKSSTATKSYIKMAAPAPDPGKQATWVPKPCL
jgi:uncharacterized protein YndB with AHSA1/START domain